jgi:hypothetical protein
MPVQNTCGSGSYELHPQKLVRLVGCRDLDRPIPKAEVEFSWKPRVTFDQEETMLRRLIALTRWRRADADLQPCGGAERAALLVSSTSRGI